MKLYRLARPLSDGKVTWLEGDYPWRVPYLACAACGRSYHAEGIAYPGISLDGLPNASDFSARDARRGVPVSQLGDLVRNLRAIVPNELDLPPGSNLGRFSGEIGNSKILRDFARFCSFPFVKEPVLDRLCQAGVTDLKPVLAAIRFKSHQGSDTRYLELQVEKTVSMVDPLDAPFGDERRHLVCAVCGRNNGHPARPLRVWAASVPADTSLMRCREYPLWKVVNEGFAEAINALQLDGVRLEPVELV